MIAADIKDIDHQISMTDPFRKAISFLRQPDLHLLQDGRVDIDGEKAFALVQRYETVLTDTIKFECHRRYIDIQYIVSGEEVIGWAPASRIKVTEEYDIDKDICFGTVPESEVTPIYLGSGQLAVLYPEDGHATKMAAGTPCRVHKIVIKVAADQALKL